MITPQLNQNELRKVTSSLRGMTQDPISYATQTTDLPFYLNI